MKEIKVNIPGKVYSVFIGKDIFTEFTEIFDKCIKTSQIAIISNDTVFGLYGKKIKKLFSNKAQVIEILVPDGEKTKTDVYLQKIYTSLLQNRFERKSCIIALGGGVIGDLAGYAAATFLRGVNLIQIPTSLLAQVDSSIGGKVGINHHLGKNLIGAFKQPAFVFSDVEFLQTLPANEIRCGMGEVIKYAFIGDFQLFEYLEKNLYKALAGDEDILLHLVTISAQQKARVVERDEREKNLRMILNFGHTFGHALEAEYGFQKLKHGEAVVLGMKCALGYSRLTKELSNNSYERGMNLLDRVPVEYDKSKIKLNKLLQRMYVDKKVSNKNIRLVLVNKIGRCIIKEKSDASLIRKAFEVLLK